jgi:hypothetical protein
MDHATMWLATAKTTEARQKAAEAHRARSARRPVVRSLVERILHPR